MKPADPSALARAMVVFDELIELPKAERQTRLDLIIAKDPLLADAVMRLLAADEDASGVLDHGVDGIAHTLLTELGESISVPQPALAASMQIASFTLIRQLGIGGMGEVWLAQRRDGSFVQDVALKLLKRGMDSDEIARRFVRERRILAELNHPHIAGFIDGGVHADGRLFYAMEYVDGVPLTSYARDHALDVRARAQLLVMVTDAVAYAQAHLVVHRDLKPSNILIDGNGQPRVLDFGIAKLVGESVADTALTSAGMRLLSPAYAAPEQIFDEPISTATDVYALGMMAYELLAGELPHQRSSNVATLADEVRDEQFATPSSVLKRDAQRTNGTTGIVTSRAQREVAGDLDVIVMTALQRDPARRYASAAALADDLKRWLDGRPIAAQSDTAGYRMRKFVGRNRLAVGSASAVLLALIAGFGVALWQASVAREQARNAEMQLQRAETIKAFTQSLFKEQDPFARSSSAARTPSELIAAGIARAKAQFNNDPVLKSELLEDLAGIQLSLGEFEPAEANLREVLDLRATRESSPVENARTESLHAIALAGLGQFQPALTEASAAAATLRAHLGADDKQTILADARRLRLWISTGTEIELMGLADDVLNRASRVFGPTATETLLAYADRTTVQERFDRNAAMQVSLEELVALIERDLGDQHSLLARPLARLGDLQRVLANNDVAEVYLDRSLAIARANELDALAGALLIRRGDNYRRQGKLDLAQADFAESAGLLKPDSMERAQLEQQRGALANTQGDFAAAVAHMQQSKAGFERALGKPSIYSWTSVIAMLGFQLKQAAAAGELPGSDILASAQAAERAMRELSPPPSFEVFFALGTLAEIEVAAGRGSEALAHFEEAIDIGGNVYSAAHPSVLDLRLKRAAAMPAARAPEAAEELQAILAMPKLTEALSNRANEALESLTGK